MTARAMAVGSTIFVLRCLAYLTMRLLAHGGQSWMLHQLEKKVSRLWKHMRCVRRFYLHQHCSIMATAQKSACNHGLAIVATRSFIRSYKRPLRPSCISI